MLIDQF